MPTHQQEQDQQNAPLQSVNTQDSTATQQEGNQKKNNTGIPDKLKAVIEHFSGFSLDEVKVHYNSEKPAEMGAHAYTEGFDVYIGPGQEKHLAHELWHVVQKMKGEVSETTKVNGKGVNDQQSLEQEAETKGTMASKITSVPENNQELVEKPLASNVVQRYVEEKVGSDDYRVTEDLSVAVKVGYPNHILYAKAGKADAANKKLQAVKSGIELEEQKKTMEFKSGGKKETLTQILPKNIQNKTEGDNMEIWADCGKSAGVVVGGTKRKAEYEDPSTGNTTTTKKGSPGSMKAEIMNKLYEDWLTKPDTEVSAEEKKAIKAAVAAAKPYYDEAQKHLKEAAKYKKTDKSKYKDFVKKYRASLKKYAETTMTFYNSLPEDRRNKIDAQLKINKSADPEVGQGYTMSTGGEKYAGGKSTWNFHWAGVIMEGDDKKDNITLENYSVGNPSVENEDWDIAMYGTSKKGQTFHEQHHDTKQHGKMPTTLVIENE